MKTFTVEILQVKYLPHRFLFDQDQIQTWCKSDRLDAYNIYFITTSKKIRFDLDRTSINMLGELKARIKIGNSDNQRIIAHAHTCNAKLFHEWFDGNPLKQVSTNFRIDRTASDDRMITALVDISDRQTFPLSIMVENALSDARIELDLPQEVVYIGQSFRMIERLRTHRRINQISSQLRDDEELRLNLVQLQLGYAGGTLHDKGWKFFLCQHDPDSKEFRDKISFIERILITFFRPCLNDQHVNTPLHEDQLVRRIIAEYDIGGIALGVGVHGPLGQFWSPNQVLNVEMGSYNFRAPEKGFQTQLDGIKEVFDNPE